MCFMITLGLQGEPGALICLNGKDTVTCPDSMDSEKGGYLQPSLGQGRTNAENKVGAGGWLTPLIRIPFSVRRVCVDQDQMAIISDVVT